jgi:ATP-dependent DNA ligase
MYRRGNAKMRNKLEQLKPMLAAGGSLRRIGELMSDGNYVAEEKFDGSRYLMHIGDTENRFTSRRVSSVDGFLVEKTDNVPHLRDLPFRTEFAGTVLDGEMIAPGKDFGSIVSIMGSNPDRAVTIQRDNGCARYMVFDMLRFSGKDITDLPFRERRRLLEGLVDANRAVLTNNHSFQLVKQEAVDKVSYFHDIVVNGGEGIVLKDLNGRYMPGERPNGVWVKVKRYLTEEVIIVGYTDPEYNYEGSYPESWRYRDSDGRPISKCAAMGWIGAIRFGMYVQDGGDWKLVELGQTSGISDAVRADISDNRDGYIGAVIEIGAMEQLPSGAFRHPRFLRLRPDKDAKDCVWRRS